MSSQNSKTISRDIIMGGTAHTFLNPSRQHSVPPIATLGASLHLPGMSKSRLSSRSNSTSTSLSDTHPQTRHHNPSQTNPRSGSALDTDSQSNDSTSSQTSEKWSRSASIESSAASAPEVRVRGLNQIAESASSSQVPAESSASYYQGNSPHNAIRDLLVPLILKNAQLRDTLMASGPQGDVRADQALTRVRKFLSDEKCREFSTLAQDYRRQMTGQGTQQNVKIESIDNRLGAPPMNSGLFDKLPELLASIKQLSSQNQEQQRQTSDVMSTPGPMHQDHTISIPCDVQNPSSQHTNSESTPVQPESEVDHHPTGSTAPQPPTNYTARNVTPEHGPDESVSIVITAPNKRRSASYVDNLPRPALDQLTSAQAPESDQRALALDDSIPLDALTLMSGSNDEDIQMNGLDVTIGKPQTTGPQPPITPQQATQPCSDDIEMIDAAESPSIFQRDVRLEEPPRTHSPIHVDNNTTNASSPLTSLETDDCGSKSSRHPSITPASQLDSATKAVAEAQFTHATTETVKSPTATPQCEPPSTTENERSPSPSLYPPSYIWYAENGHPTASVWSMTSELPAQPPRIKLELFCFLRTDSARAYDTLGPDSTDADIVEATRNMPISWPSQGSILLGVNDRWHWCPNGNEMNSIDLSEWIINGTENTLRLIQLADLSDYVFVVVVSRAPNPEVDIVNDYDVEDAYDRLLDEYNKRLGI